MSDHSGIFSGYAITNITVSEIIIQCCCLGVSMYLCLGSRQANTKYALLSLILFMGAAGLCTFPQDFYWSNINIYSISYYINCMDI